MALQARNVDDWLVRGDSSDSAMGKEEKVCIKASEHRDPKLGNSPTFPGGACGNILKKTDF